jgi:hypothetical protein
MCRELSKQKFNSTKRTGRQYREEGEPLLALCDEFVRFGVWQPRPAKSCEQASTVFKTIVFDKDVEG